jgi:DNA-binding response OmpR family regulator
MGAGKRPKRESVKQERTMQVVIVAKSGRLRDGLQAMLDSFPALQPLALEESGPAALEAIGRQQPDLVIVDADLCDEDRADWVKAMKQEWNRARCLAIAGRLAQFQPFLDAGADEVLLKGFSAAELRAAIKKLLD